LKIKSCTPRIALEAIDSDVIKTYVRTGFGHWYRGRNGRASDGNTSGNASGDSNQDLAVVNVGHLFGKNVTRVAFKRSGYLRNFVYTFAELLSERLSKAAIVSAMNGKATGENDDYAM
jgi:LysR family cys regulon transcriptional activator